MCVYIYIYIYIYIYTHTHTYSYEWYVPMYTWKFGVCKITILPGWVVGLQRPLSFDIYEFGFILCNMCPGLEYTYVYACAYVHTYICVCVFTLRHTFMCFPTYICIQGNLCYVIGYTFMYACTCVHTCLYISPYIHVRTCIHTCWQ